MTVDTLLLFEHAADHQSYGEQQDPGHYAYGWVVVFHCRTTVGAASPEQRRRDGYCVYWIGFPPNNQTSNLPHNTFVFIRELVATLSTPAIHHIMGLASLPNKYKTR